MTSAPLDPIAIDVGRLIEPTLASLYSNLVTRQTGRAVRLAIEARLAAANGRSLSLIDLSEVAVLDFSCADEVVAKLIQRCAGPEGPESFFVLRSVAEPHRDPIETVLVRQSLAVVAETASGGFELLGYRTAEEGDAWAFLEGRGLLTEDDLAAPLLPVERRSALGSLVRRHLAFQHPTTGSVYALGKLARELVQEDRP